METKKITLNELRSIVKQIISEEMAAPAQQGQQPQKVDATQTANQIKLALEKKGLKGIIGKGNGPDKALAQGVDFAISLENMAWGIGAYVYLKNNPQMQAVAKEIYQNYGGSYSQGFEQGKVVGITNIGYKQ